MQHCKLDPLELSDPLGRGGGGGGVCSDSAPPTLSDKSIKLANRSSLCTYTDSKDPNIHVQDW